MINLKIVICVRIGYLSRCPTYVSKLVSLSRIRSEFEKRFNIYIKTITFKFYYIISTILINVRVVLDFISSLGSLIFIS